MNGSKDHGSVIIYNNMGKQIGRKITVEVYEGGRMKVTAPSQKDWSVMALQKAIEAIKTTVPDTSASGIEIVPGNIRVGGA